MGQRHFVTFTAARAAKRRHASGSPPAAIMLDQEMRSKPGGALVRMKLDFEATDERRVLADGRVLVDVVRVGRVPVLRVTHAPGWRWSTHSAPAVGTVGCGNVHVGVMTSGRMMVKFPGVAAHELQEGDTFAIHAGHDAWTVGDEPAVLVQFDEGTSAQARYGR